MSNTAMANTAQALMDSMTPKFAVSYLRVSTRGQAERGGGHDEGFSIPAQREANKKKALSMGAMVGKEFVDRGASAKSADRPQLQAMLEYVKENADRVDYVIVHKVDRLARNRDDDSDIMRVLRECGVQLVSASESIDDTPAGMLLHGIMSSIAEFYSQNLATEVKKGMGEKIKSGGTVGRAPIGYQNVRYVDEKGREERTVITDPERAPLIKLAFEEYATGNWTVADLADHLAACGLNTRSTPKIPSQPITLKTLHKVLVNPYYNQKPLVVPTDTDKARYIYKVHHASYITMYRYCVEAKTLTPEDIRKEEFKKAYADATEDVKSACDVHRRMRYEFIHDFSALNSYEPEIIALATRLANTSYGKPNQTYLGRLLGICVSNYGWLEPNGTFHPVEWCEHQQFAYNILVEREWLEEYEAFDKHGISHAGDFLTSRKGWVLLHNPGRGVAYATRDESKRLTKAQREFLFAYYSDRGCKETAAKYLEE